jgi:hypothetical protein
LAVSLQVEDPACAALNVNDFGDVFVALLNAFSEMLDNRRGDRPGQPASLGVKHENSTSGGSWVYTNRNLSFKMEILVKIY